MNETAKTTMQGETGNKWLDLCEQAAVERDTQKLRELMQEINRLLKEKEQRLTQAPQTESPAA